jgi:hypothetical protein
MAIWREDRLFHRTLKSTSVRSNRWIGGSQVVQPNRVDHDPLQAMNRAMYSTVNNATKVVSNPNQILTGMEWNAGTVSRTVTRAETMINAVEKTCIRNAAGDEAGFSSTAWRVRFHWDPGTVRSFDIEGNASSTSRPSGAG